jgi:hypothetical protein
MLTDERRDDFARRARIDDFSGEEVRELLAEIDRLKAELARAKKKEDVTPGETYAKSH